VTPAIIQITPDPILFSVGPLQIGWYGLAYVVALGALVLVSQREAILRGFDPAHVGTAFLLVLPFAVVGGRLYHVIHEWDAIYSADPLRAILPPYSGLGLYGGVAGAAIAILIYCYWKKLPLRIALDVVIPGTLFAQGIARWGNFFNQELYGPPTSAPWGIAIDCAHRIAPWFCPGDPRLAAGVAGFPLDTTGFHPLFFYESALDILGGLVALYIARRFLPRLRPGDLAAFWGIWYGSVRAILESFREGWNWTLGGIATAQWIGIVVVLIGIAWIAWNHRPGSRPYQWRPPWTAPERVAVLTAEDEADYYAPTDAAATEPGAAAGEEDVRAGDDDFGSDADDEDWDDSEAEAMAAEDDEATR
jgi:phosphatidylglycerol:prolipoprotein diacylglycerol transferase